MRYEPIEESFPENMILVMYGSIIVKDGQFFFDIDLEIDPLFGRIIDAVNRVIESQIEED